MHNPAPLRTWSEAPSLRRADKSYAQVDWDTALRMASAAAAQGIPPSAIFVETRAKDTIQNACLSEQLMKAHGWRSAEVISSSWHLPRVGLILRHTSLEWRTHAAPPLEPGGAGGRSDTVMETLKTLLYLLYANWAERCDGSQ